jgi:hypothetical protein
MDPNSLEAPLLSQDALSSPREVVHCLTWLVDLTNREGPHGCLKAFVGGCRRVLLAPPKQGEGRGTAQLLRADLEVVRARDSTTLVSLQRNVVR